MTEETAELLNELRRLIADLKGASDAAYFPSASELITIREAIARVHLTGVNGAKVGVRIMNFWRRTGWRGVRLKMVSFMCRWYTCERWLTEFVKECSQISQERGNIVNLKRGGCSRRWPFKKTAP